MKLLALLNTVLFFLSGFWPRKRTKVLFGAWLGARFADNPKYLAMHLAAHGHGLDLVWVGTEATRSSLPADGSIRFVRIGSLRALHEALTAAFCFITHSTFDLTRLTVLRGAQVVYLGHGLALKNMGTPDVPLSSRVLQFARSLVRKPECYAYFVACSTRHREKLLREYAINGARGENVLATGQPRVDFLLANREAPAAGRIRKALLASIGVPPARRVIAYLPTFRDKRARAFSFLALEGRDLERLNALLEKFDAVLLEKSHFADASREGAGTRGAARRIFNLAGGAPVDTQELLLSTDLLVTDYSGCFFDFLVLDRPVIHFAYDREYYVHADRGLYFHLDDAAAGPIVAEFEDLCGQIELDLAEPGRFQARRGKLCREMMEFEMGTACRQISRAVLGVGP